MNYSTTPRLLLTAPWIFPVASDPIKNGGLLLNGPLIEAVLDAASVKKTKAENPQLPCQNLASAAIIPGLFNLHTHLDYTNLAYLGTFDGETMFDWLEQLVSQSRSQLNTEEILQQSALDGATEAALCGTSYVVDSTFSGAAAYGLAQVGLKGLVGLELFGLDADAADFLFKLWLERLAKLTATAGGALQEALTSARLRLTVAPHAPYTVAPALWKKAQAWAREHNRPLTCHLAESQNEYDWIFGNDERLEQYLLKVMPKNPAKDLASMLKSLPWRGLGHSPVAHLQKNDLLDADLIAAHGLRLDQKDIETLVVCGTKIALCPRSNKILKNGLPQKDLLNEKRLTTGFGTDSRASSPNLSLLQEAAYLRAQFLALEQGELDYRRLLTMLTLDSARAVGLENESGSLEPGKCADLAAFNLSNDQLLAQALESTTSQETAASQVLQSLFENKSTCQLLLVDGRTIVREGRLA